MLLLSQFPAKIVIAIGCAIASLLAFGALFTATLSSDFTDSEKLKLASHWLDDGRWDLAGKMAQDISKSTDVDENASWHYVEGVSQLLRIMDDVDSYQNRMILIRAAKHLEKSREIGFPLGYRGKGNFFLGVCLFHTYRWNEAIEALDCSLTDYPESRSSSLQMIFSAHLRKPQPDTEAAQAILHKWMHLPGLSQRELSQTWIAQAQLAIEQNVPQDSYQWISKIPSGLPEYYEGRKWQALSYIYQALQYPAQSVRRTEQLNQAQELLQDLIVASQTPQSIRRQSFYLAGRVLRYQGRFQEAVSTFSGVRQQSPFSAEAIASSLEEAEILMDLDRTSEVVGTTRHLLSGISDVRLYNERWMSLDELRTRLIQLGNRLLGKEKYELALELADQLTIAFPLSHALRLQATTLANWGFALQNELKPNDMKTRQAMIDIFAHAGTRYEQLAKLELRSRDYLNIVWSAAENYQKAGRLSEANRMIQDYLKYESRSKQTRALLALGRNYITAGEWKASLEPLQQCLVEYPTSPNSYEARYLAAQALTELNELDRAIELLSANLWDYELHPESPTWKDSFMELGNLLFQSGNRTYLTVHNDPDIPWSEAEPILQRSHDQLLKAVDQLSEATRRYPTDPRVNLLRYQLARGYQLAAQLPHRTAQTVQSLSDSTKRQLSQQRNRLLEKSVEEYVQLHQNIAAEPESARSDSLDPSILRSAFFGQSDVLYELGRYEEAIEAYRAAAAYYTNRPESLEALVQIAECYRKLGRDGDAQKTIRQAELVLERIPSDRDASFVSTTRGDRRHWQQTLGRLKQWN